MMSQRFFAKLFVLAGILLSLISHSSVSAQQAAGGNRARKSTTIDFEDELVQGDIKKPELLFLMQKKQFNFKRLIKLREDFIPEMRRTSEDIKSGDKP